MNYQETLTFLFSQLPMFQRIGKAAYKANLDNTLALDKYFKHPHRKFKSVHIAGTNGKGSVSHMLASVLQESGYKVGLYTSPHLLDFRERIRINGEVIPEKKVIDFVENHSTIIKDLKPSFFEITVAMAFDFFANENVDIAVTEVGLGGRLDSTNIISPELGIITNIGFDHMMFLGDNLKQIAGEKAGIIKKNIPIIIGQTKIDTKPVFEKKANQLNSEIIFADQVYTIDYEMLSTDNFQTFNIKEDEKIIFKNLKLDLLGNYQKQNTITALSAIIKLQKLNWNISNDNIFNGFSKIQKNTGLAGRWQVISYNPQIICDTAHNIDGIGLVFQQIKNTAYKNLHIVFGMVDDKTIESVLALLPKTATYYFTKASVPRALNENVLREKSQEFNLVGNSFANVNKAINSSLEKAAKNDLIFIGGSTFVVADALEYFNKQLIT